MSTILITGGTGLVGTALTELLLQKGYKVVILSRKKRKSNHANLQYAFWDTEEGIIEEGIISSADYIVHLAGENVAEKRWTKKRKEEILTSRIQPGKCIVKALSKTPNNVKAVISASAIGWYGPDSNNGSFVETDPHYNDFLGETCFQWENSMSGINEMGIRLVTLRLGIVLSEKGGALKEFMKPLAFGIAACMGQGNQMISWIHLDDLCNMILYAIENQQMKGVYNAVSPNPVSNKTLIGELKKEMKKAFSLSISIPTWFLKLLLGELSIEILKSTTVSADKILKTGFLFHYPTIKNALKQLVDKKNTVNTQ